MLGFLTRIKNRCQRSNQGDVNRNDTKLKSSIIRNLAGSCDPVSQPTAFKPIQKKI